MSNVSMMSFRGQWLAVVPSANQPVQFFDGRGTLARCAFEQVPVAGGGVALHWFAGNQYLMAHPSGSLYGWAVPADELQDAGRNGAYAFVLEQGGDGLYRLRNRDGRALGGAAGLLLNGQQWNEPLELQLHDGTPDFARLQNACGDDHGSHDPHSRRLQWEKDVHANMVGRAFNVFGRLREHEDARRLHDLFGDFSETPKEPGHVKTRQEELMAELQDGLLKADTESLYSGVIWGKNVFYKHFFDPRVRQNYLLGFGYLFDMAHGTPENNFTDNAYTEALRYAQQAARYFGTSDDHEMHKKGAFALGLALHYVSDLSQPMHATNTINFPIFGEDSNLGDWRHHNLETFADEHRNAYLLPAEAMNWDDIRPDNAEFRSSSMPALLDRIAWKSVDIYNNTLEPVLDGAVWNMYKGNLFSDAQVGPALRQAIPHGQRASAAFLLLWSRLGLGHIWSGKTNMGYHSGWAPNFFRHGNRNWTVLADSDAHDTRFRSLNGNFDPDNVHDFVHGYSNCFEVPSVASDGGQQLVSAWHAHGSMSLWTGFAVCDDLNRNTEWHHVNLPDARIKDYTSPTVFHIQGRFWMVWVDYGHCLPGGEGIYISLADTTHRNWSTPRKIPGVGTTHSPAVLVRGNQLWLAWTGTQSHEGIFWTTSTDCENWDAQQQTPFVSRSGPGLGVLNGKPYLFWRAPNDEIHYSVYSDYQWSFPPRPVLTPDVWSHQDVRAVTLEGQIVVGWNNAWWPHRLVLKDGYA